MTTTSAADKLVQVAQLLRAGETPAQVAGKLDLTEQQVRDLTRDIPGLNTPQQPTVPMRVGAGTPIAGIRTAISGASRPPVTLVGATPTGAPTAPLTIARLLEEASVHSNAGVRRAGQHIESKLDTLRKQLKNLAATEAAKQQALATKAKAKAEIARLEAELAAAKAKLKKTPNPSGRILTPEQRTSAAANLAKARRPVDCDQCGRTFGHAGALGNHKKTCSGGGS